MRIPCKVKQRLLSTQRKIDGEWVRSRVPGVIAICPRCKHRTRSYGTEDPSIKRCLVMLRRECPLDETNTYVEDVGLGPDDDL